MIRALQSVELIRRVVAPRLGRESATSAVVGVRRSARRRSAGWRRHFDTKACGSQRNWRRQLLDIIGARSPQIMGAVDMGADGAIVVQDNENGVNVVKAVITGDQRAQELEERAKVLAECQAKDEKIALLEAKVEDGVETKLQATRLFCSMARRGRRHRGEADNSLVDFHTDR